MTPLIIRFGGYQPPKSIHNEAAQAFGEALTSKLGSDVEFQFTGNVIDQGHRVADLVSMVDGGELEMCYYSTSHMLNFVPEFSLFDLPFIINQRKDGYAILDGPLGREMSEKLASDSNFRILGYWDNGFRHLTNRIGPIQTPADCNGLRIRTLMSDLHARVFELLGFDPIRLDVRGLIASLRSEEIDAQDNALTNIYNFGVHKYHPYITLSGHFFGVVVLIFNATLFGSLSKEQQIAIEEAAMEATAIQRKAAAKEDDLILKKFDSADTEIVTLTNNERVQFIEAVAPILEEQREYHGDALFKYL